ncbi:MAG: hypothetical protein WCG06_03200, partial [Candidatus Omnitrophota bacterium]
MDISNYIGAAEEIPSKDKDAEKIRGGYRRFRSEQLLPDMIISETYYEGKGEDQKAMFVLSGFDDTNDMPTTMAVHIYDGKILKETKTYNIEDKNAVLGDAENRKKLKIGTLKSLAASLTDDDLESVSFFQGEAGKEKIWYTLTDFDDTNKPNLLTYYTYDGERLKSVDSFDLSEIDNIYVNGKLDLNGDQLKAVLVESKLKDFTTAEILDLLKQRGLLKGDLISILGQISGADFMESLTAKELLQLLYSKGFLGQDADSTLAMLDFQGILDSLSADELLSFLVDHGYLAEASLIKDSQGRIDKVATLAGLKAKLAARGLDLSTANGTDILDSLEGLTDADNLLTMSVVDLINDIKVEDLLSSMTSDELIKFLASTDVNLLKGSAESALATLSKDSILGLLTVSELISLLISKGLTTKGSLAELLASISFDDVLSEMTADELTQALLDAGLIKRASDLAGIKSLLASKGISLDGKNTDQVLAILEGEGFLKVSAGAAREAIKGVFNADRAGFLEKLSGTGLLKVLTDGSLLTTTLDGVLNALSVPDLIGALSAAELISLLISKGLTTKGSLAELLSAISFDDVLSEMTADQIVQALFESGLLKGVSDLAAVKQLLAKKGIILDGKLAAEILGILEGQGLLKVSAALAIAALKSSFESDRTGFLNRVGSNGILKLLTSKNI